MLNPSKNRLLTLARLAAESPYEGERNNAALALKRLQTPPPVKPHPRPRSHTHNTPPPEKPRRWYKTIRKNTSQRGSLSHARVLLQETHMTSTDIRFLTGLSLMTIFREKLKIALKKKWQFSL